MHVDAEGPGELVGVDCFFVGRLQGTRGTFWQLTVTDVASSYAWADLVSCLRSTRTDPARVAAQPLVGVADRDRAAPAAGRGGQCLACIAVPLIVGSEVLVGAAAAEHHQTRRRSSAPNLRPRKDQLHPDPGPRRRALGGLLRDRLRLEHPEGSDGEVKFDDTVGEVSGTWVTGRVPSAEPGLVVYMLVESVEQTLDKIREAGGEVVTPLTPQGEGEAFATFRDSAGNVLGIGQQP